MIQSGSSSSLGLKVSKVGSTTGINGSTVTNGNSTNNTVSSSLNVSTQPIPAKPTSGKTTLKSPKGQKLAAKAGTTGKSGKKKIVKKKTGLKKTKVNSTLNQLTILCLYFYVCSVFLICC